VGILLLGATAVITILRLSVLDNVLNITNDLVALLWNRIFISCVWTAVCVFTPVWYANHPIVPQTWMTYAYLLQLIFINAALWKVEKNPQIFGDRRISSCAVLILQGLCWSSALLAIIDVMLGYFPLHNLVVVLAPIVTFVIITYWLRPWENLRITFTVLTFAQAGCSVLAMFVHVR
jgi:uncharacterized membrane protein